MSNEGETIDQLQKSVKGIHQVYSQHREECVQNLAGTAQNSGSLLTALEFIKRATTPSMYFQVVQELAARKIVRFSHLGLIVRDLKEIRND